MPRRSTVSAESIHVTDDIVRGISTAAFPGGFFFVRILWALGALGGVTMILSVRALWMLRQRGER